VLAATDLQVGDYVVARLPEATTTFAAARGYLPRSVPALKQIVALPGQKVCIRNGSIHIDGIAVARTLNEDGEHRPLAPWKACRPLVEGEVFLLNSTNPASFDSRYFGPLDVSFVRGRAVHLWAVCRLICDQLCAQVAVDCARELHCFFRMMTAGSRPIMSRVRSATNNRSMARALNRANARYKAAARAGN